MAICCLIYLIIYAIICLRVSKVNQCQVATVAEAVMAPVYPSNQNQVPMTISHHQQSSTLSSYPYQGAVPVMMAVYPLSVSSLPSNCNYVQHIPYSTTCPQLANERF